MHSLPSSHSLLLAGISTLACMGCQARILGNAGEEEGEEVEVEIAGSAGVSLTCNFPGRAIPIEQTYTAFPFGKTIAATIGFARRFGQVGSSFYIHKSSTSDPWTDGIDILDGRSAAGAGFQTTFFGQTKQTGEDRVWVFNQAAGNMDQQWGYSSNFVRQYGQEAPGAAVTRFSHHEWLPLYSDHWHPAPNGVPDFLTSTGTSPCAHNGEAYFEGLMDVRSFGTPVLGDTTNRDWSSSHIVQLQNEYTLRATASTDWRFMKIEQALYLNKWIAAKHDLRVYLVGPGGEWATGPIHPHWDRNWMPALEKEPLTDAPGTLHCSGIGGSLDNTRCAMQLEPISMAILVWNHDGEDMGFAIHKPDYSEFFGDLARNPNITCNAAETYLDSNGAAESMSELEAYHDCGNLEWHSMLKGNHTLDADPIHFETGQEYRVAMRYSLGNLRELVQLAEDSFPNMRIDIDTNGYLHRSTR